MPQDGTFVGPQVDYLTDEQQALLRMPPVVHHNERGYSQAFRGFVGFDATEIDEYGPWEGI